MLHKTASIKQTKFMLSMQRDLRDEKDQCFKFARFSGANTSRTIHKDSIP